MSDYRQELRRLAKAAIHGDWFKSGDLRYHDDKTGEVHGLNAEDDRLIAATSPDAILALLDELERLESYKAAYMEWQDKTEWVQKTAQAKELGRHRADILAERLKSLDAECAALAASACDGVVGDDYGNAYCKYKAELAALKGVAGEEPKTAAFIVTDTTEEDYLRAKPFLLFPRRDGSAFPMCSHQAIEPLMTIAQHQRIVAAMARDAEGLVQALEWYAEKVKECRKIGPTGDTARQALDLDGGFRALDALAAHRAGKEGKA